MSAPAVRVQVHFDVARNRRGVAELDNRAAKVRAAFAIQKTRMKNADRITVQAPELIAQEALVLPDRLEQIFRRRIGVVAQDRHRAAAEPPLRVEILGHGEHRLAFADGLLQCQAECALWRVTATRRADLCGIAGLQSARRAEQQSGRSLAGVAESNSARRKIKNLRYDLARQRRGSFFERIQGRF